MKVHELKSKLQGFLEELENYDDFAEVDLWRNTYRLYGDYIAIGGKGYVSLSEPVEVEEEDEY